MSETVGAKAAVRALLLFVSLALTVQRAAIAAPGLLFATTLGGSQSDTIRAIATDSAHNIYVVGETNSADFPRTGSSGAIRKGADAFIVKLNSSGNQILYSVILSGTGYDSIRGVAIDPSGYVYVIGVTSSPDFPTTSNAFQRSAGSVGLEDAFVAKLSPAGELSYATYLGGSSSDWGYAIAVSANGAAYVAGSTASTDFPVTQLAPQKTFRGGTSDCFVAKLDPTGATLQYASYLGGENIDVCKSIAVDSAGQTFVTGTTLSAGFPTVAAFKPNLTGGSDAFLAKFSAAGDRLLFSTYLGGTGADDGNVVRLDQASTVYVAGDTSSTSFPVVSPALQDQNRGGYDAFIIGLAIDGSRIVFSTYLGGSGSDAINDLFVGEDGRLVAAGYTTSTDFPTAQPIQTSFAGSFDAFVAVIGVSGKSLDFSTYLGGSGDDRAYSVAPLGSGQLVVGGQAIAGAMPYIPNPFTGVPAGQMDALIAGISYPQPLRFIPATPCRVADTRNPSGPFGGPTIPGGASRDFAVTAGPCGIPSTARAYSLNVTVVPSGVLGYLSIWPSGQPRAYISVLNSPDGRLKSNAVIVPAGLAGAISIFSTDTAHVILDINGYFVDAVDSAALEFFVLRPCRVVDTRLMNGPLGGPSLSALSSRTFALGSSGCGVPSSARAYSLNFTVVPRGPLGFLSTWPSGSPRPWVSTLNIPTGTLSATAAIVPAGQGGGIDVFVTDPTDLVIDINGYFAPVGEGGLSLYTISPCRAFDSRLPLGSPPIGGTQDINIDSSGCVPPAVARAFILNATAIPIGQLGFLSLWPKGQAWPGISTLNATDGMITSNLAIVPGSNGLISSYETDKCHIVLDAFGYFAP